MAMGDVLFYAGAADLWDRVVRWRTHGRFTHVGVDLGDGSMIDATNSGVTLHRRYEPDGAWATIAHTGYTDLQHGLEWLHLQLHDGYGFLDAAQDALPAWFPFSFHIAHQYDCSHLVARYLIESGLSNLLGKLVERPERVTPNDLARAMNVS